MDNLEKETFLCDLQHNLVRCLKHKASTDSSNKISTPTELFIWHYQATNSRYLNFNSTLDISHLSSLKQCTAYLTGEI